MEKLTNIATSLSRIFDAMARYFLLGMILLIVVNVLCRLTPIGPIDGTFELIGYLGALVTAFALARNEIEGGNISVEFLVQRLPESLQTLSKNFGNFVGLVVYIVVSWRLAVEAISVYKSGEVSATLSLPFYPIIITVAVGCLMLGFVLLTDFIKILKKRA